jgi:hypothetical protein
MWPELAVSRDGIQWAQPFAGQPLIPTGAAGAKDSLQIRMSSSMIVLDDKIVFIYGQTDRPHVADMQVDIGMATMRLDGFAAMAADDQVGLLRTKPFVLEGNRLILNGMTDAGKDGWIRVSLLDEMGSVIPGFSDELCVPIQGDGIALPVAWNPGASLASLRGETVSLQFEMQNAMLYSFAVQAPEPGGLVLSLTGGLVLAGYACRKRRRAGKAIVRLAARP